MKEIDIDIGQLDACLNELKATLKDGLIASEIWTVDGLSLTSTEVQPGAVALFTRIVEDLVETLRHSGFPAMKRYYLSDLDGDHTAMTIFHGDDIQHGLLLNSKKVNLGVLLSVAMPRAMALVAKARR